MRLGLLRGMLGLPMVYMCMKMLKNIAEAVSHVVGLQDPTTEDVKVKPDRVGVGGSYNVTSVDQSLVTAAELGKYQPNVFPSNLDIPGSLETTGEKFYLLFGDEWTTSHVYLQKLAECKIFHLMKISQFAVTANMRYHRYMRAGVEVMVQVNAQKWQLGALLCMLVPGSPDGISYSGFGMLPHGIINLSINNVVRMKAPWVYTRGSYDIQDPVEEPWSLVVIVLSELRPNGGVTFNVLGRFCDVEMHALHPARDGYAITQMMSQRMSINLGAQVVNLSNKSGAEATMNLALGCDHMLDDMSGCGGLRVDNLKLWATTPGLMGRFPFNGSATYKQKIAEWTVNPYYYCVRDEDQMDHPPPLASVAEMFAFWRCDMVYHIQVVASPFHSGRLLIAFIPGNETMVTSRIDMQAATNSMCAIMDIAGVNSTCVFRVPYTADTHYRVNKYVMNQKVAYRLKKHYDSIGKVCVYVYNKLRYPSNVQQNVMINVFVSAANPEFYCPIYTLIQSTLNTDGNNSLSPRAHFNSYIGVVTQAGDDDGRFESAGTVSQDKTKDQFYINAPEKQIPMGATSAIEDPVLEQEKPQTFEELAPGKPRHAVDHMRIDEFMGRAHFWFTFSFNQASSGVRVFSVPLDIRRKDQSTKGFGGVLQWFFSMIHLYRGPVDVTVVLRGGADVDGICWYTPPGVMTSALWDQSNNQGLTVDYVTSFGAVRFNSRTSAGFQVRVPWANDLYAVSACVRPDCDDTCLGYLSFYISNYTGADDRLGIAAYLSIPKEGQCLVPRPPLRTNLVYPSEGALGYRDLTAVESDVDFEDKSEPTVVPPQAERRRLIVEQNLYRDLRMEVGAHRLAYAFEELQKEPESQAGNMFENFVLVQRRVGRNVQRGFAFDGKIYTAICNNEALSSMPVLKTGQLVAIDEDGSWLSLGSKIDSTIAMSYVAAFVSPIAINWKSFMAGDFVAGLESGEYLRLDTACNGELVNVLSVFQGKSLGLVDRALADSDIFQQVLGTSGSVKELADECKKLVSQIQRALDGIAVSVSRKRRQMIVRIISCVVKTAVRIYMCQHFGWDRNVVIPTLLEFSMDTMECGFDLVGMLRSMLQLVASETDEPTTQSLDLRDVVSCITIFKSAKSCFDWCVGKVSEWYNTNYGDTKQRMDEILDNEERIKGLLEYADQFCTKQVINKEDYAEGCYMLSQMRTLLSSLTHVAELRPLLGDLRDSIRTTHLKLRGVPSDMTNAHMRVEPVVAYISGPRGSGKSLLSMAIATKLCKAHGVDPRENIYTKPPCSEFWDGYNNQLVVIMDDVGQRTDDEDWMDFCQLVSTCPVRVNMAAIESKGQHFKTPFIICTSNLHDPDPKTIYCRDAILRRLHLKLRVTPSDYYKTSIDGLEVLDLVKAKRDGMVGALECLNILDMSGKRIGLMDVVDSMLNTLKTRQETMDEFVSIWSQAGVSGYDFIKTYMRTEREWLSGVFKHLRDHKIYVIGSVLSLLSACGVFYAGYRLLRRPRTEGVYNTMPRRNVVRLSEVTTQSLVDLSGVVQKALVRFGVSNDGDIVRWRLNAVCLFENWLMVPSHCFKFEPEISHFFILKGSTTYVVRRDQCVVVESEGCPDICYIMIPGLPKSRDIRNHFVRECDVRECDGRLATLVTNNGGIFQMITEGDIRLCEGVTYRHPGVEPQRTITLPRVWKGRGESLQGSCGGILISANNKIGCPFVGAHVAAGGGCMYAGVITREEVMSIATVTNANSRIVQVQCVSRPVSTSNKSSFHRSVLYDHFPRPAEKAPAALLYQRKNELDVLAVMMCKYHGVDQEKPFGFQGAAVAYSEQLVKAIGCKPPMMLTVKEAVLGFQGLDPLDMSTSPGLPYVLDGKRKRDMIKDGVIVDEMLEKRLKQHLTDMGVGVASDVVFMTCLKDELRPIQKVIDCVTRGIEVSPVCYTIAMRMMLGRFVSDMHLNYGWATGSAVGIDPDSDWTPLFESALRFGDVGIAMDFKNYDASVHAYMIQSAMEVIGMVSGLPSPIVDSIATTLKCSTRQIGTLRYKVVGAIPSGVSCTSILNTMINNIMFRYVMAKVLGITAFDVGLVCKFIAYGDDISKHDVIYHNIGALDLVKLEEEYRKLGFTVTGPDKLSLRILPVTELRFLKRTPLYRDAVFHPCIDEATINSLVQWKRENAKLEDNIFTACRFAFHYGRAYYEYFVADVTIAMQSATKYS
uniref:Genome polyprotein n=1 Tax=bar-headed goose hepatovirus TaxID=3155981 RepID=A0AAU7B996_9PICO